MTLASLIKIAAFVAPLGVDTLAVSILLGLKGLAPLRPAVTFAAFEALVPLIGLLLGRLAGAYFAAAAQIVGGLMLVGVAAYIVREALEDEDETATLSFSSLRLAAAAGLGVSMDELAVGFPMGTSGLPIAATLAAIAVQTFVVTVAGVLAGRAAGAALGHAAARAMTLSAGAAFGLLGLYLIAQRLVPGLPVF